MLRYGLYARKSKDDKSGQIKSIQDQIAVWQALAQERGLAIVKVYEENKTAKIPGVRPVYKQMISDIKAGEIDGILVWHVNRLARNMEEGGSLAQMLIDKKVQEIHTPNATYRPTDNILPFLLEQGTSTQYSIDLSNRVTMAIASMVQAGGWPHQAKVGYLNRRDPVNPKRGIIVTDPDRFDLIRRAFDMLLTGAYSVKKVVDTLNDEWGFRTRTTPSRPGGPLSYAAAYDIFTNAFYAGFMTHNGVQRRGNHLPMITVAEYNRLLHIVRRTPSARERKREFTYRGLIKCGLCGMTITADRHFKSGRERIYYHCSDPYLKCTKKGISEERLEAEIIRMLEDCTIDPAFAEIALENIARWQGEERAGAAGVLLQQQQTLADIERQRSNLLTLMLKGLLTDEAVYQAKEAHLLEERNNLQRGLLQTEQEAEHIREVAASAASYLQRAHEAFLMGSDDRKKEITRALAEYALKGNDLEITIDPLLGEFIKYVNLIKTKLEPPKGKSQSRYKASISPPIYFGRDTGNVLEPSPNLIRAFSEGMFPSFFAQGS